MPHRTVSGNRPAAPCLPSGRRRGSFVPSRQHLDLAHPSEPRSALLAAAFGCARAVRPRGIPAMAFEVGIARGPRRLHAGRFIARRETTSMLDRPVVRGLLRTRRPLRRHREVRVHDQRSRRGSPKGQRERHNRRLGSGNAAVPLCAIEASRRNFGDVGAVEPTPSMPLSFGFSQERAPLSLACP
jgi:hypothetical protein